MTKEELNDPEIIRMLDDMNTDRVGAKPPIDLSEATAAYADPIDSRFEIDQMMNDLIMAEYVDETEEGDVVRGGILIKANMTHARAWRTAIVRKVGPKVPEQIRPGAYIRFPSDKGLPSIQGKHKYIFLNADRIFCTMRLKDGEKAE